MSPSFHAKALAAAFISPEAFANEFKKAEADANAKDPSPFSYGRRLIHSIIIKIPDVSLPNLLDILIEHGVNLETECYHARTPLSIAVQYQKKKAIDFLVKNNANIDRALLYEAIKDPDGDHETTRDIVKILMENGADINFQNRCGETPIMLAARKKNIPVLRYLVSLGSANLFLRRNLQPLYQTTVGAVYYIYMHAKWSQNNFLTESTKECLFLLMQHITKDLSLQGLEKNIEELFIDNVLRELAANIIDDRHFSQSDYEEHQSANITLKKLLDTHVKPLISPAIRRERAERKYAFCMGSILNQTQLEKGTQSSAYCFFQKDGNRDLSREIFSFIYPTINGK